MKKGFLDGLDELLIAAGQEPLSKTAKPLIEEFNQYTPPCRTFVSFNFLSNLDRLPRLNGFEHVYERIPQGFWLEIHPVTIIHGHSVGDQCFASYFCHEMSYRPPADSHPAFIKQFYLKWEHLYGKQNT